MLFLLLSFLFSATGMAVLPLSFIWYNILDIATFFNECHWESEVLNIINPFLSNHALETNASINKLRIVRMPDCTVTEDLTGKTAQEIFSTDRFIQEIKQSADLLKIRLDLLEERSLPMMLEQCLISGDRNVRETARRLLKLFGERLAVILLCLKEGDPVNQGVRSDWDSSHWKYWSALERVILVGGLSSPPLGEHLKFYVEQVFSASGKFPYQIILGQDATYAGIRGCAAFLPQITEDSKITDSAITASLIFDYGQSFIKRSYILLENGRLKDIVLLEKTLSQHVEWDLSDEHKELEEAALLNQHFLKTINETIDEVESMGFSINPNIILSIANYVKNGVIVNRGGYGKLRLIAPNYSLYLGETLKNDRKRDFYFTLIHDGTATAAGYRDYENAVCISLGTAFGIGFPNP